MESVARRPVRLFLVGLSEGLARSVARYVGGDPRIALTGVAPSLALAGMLLSATESELALLDWSAVDGSTREAVRALRVGCPGLRIVCMANEAEPYRAAASQAGADSVISKDDFAGELESLLRGFFPERFRASPP
jgi:DNA-binding NarL/FixJ family response regulator